MLGWETLKRLDFRKRLDLMLAGIEQMEDTTKEFEPTFEKIKDDQLKTGLRNCGEAIMSFIKFQREQVIWINALREGMIKFEDRLDKLENAVYTV